MSNNRIEGILQNRGFEETLMQDVGSGRIRMAYTLTCTGTDVDWAFRQCLGGITDDETTPLSKRVETINALTIEHGRDLDVEDARLVSEYIRCFTYCFDLVSYVPQMERMQACPNDRYVHFLVERGHLTMRSSSGDAEDGDHAVYFTSDLGYQHGGIWVAGRVRSKWGRLPVFTHGVWDVPQPYGNHVRLYPRIERELAWSSFEEWVTSSES